MIPNLSPPHLLTFDLDVSGGGVDAGAKEGAGVEARILLHDVRDGDGGVGGEIFIRFIGYAVAGGQGLVVWGG